MEFVEKCFCSSYDDDLSILVVARMYRSPASLCASSDCSFERGSVSVSGLVSCLRAVGKQQTLSFFACEHGGYLFPCKTYDYEQRQLAAESIVIIKATNDSVCARLKCRGGSVTSPPFLLGSVLSLSAQLSARLGAWTCA